MTEKKFKDIFEPDKKFLKKSRQAFLASLNILAKTRHQRISIIYRLKIGISAVFFLFFMTAGTLVLADQSKIGTRHPLYPVKRLSEKVQSRIGTQNSAVLHEKFARRRLDEIEKIKARKANADKAIANLKNDFVGEAEMVEQNNQNPEEKNKQISELCALAKGMDNGNDNNERWGNFKKHCDDLKVE